MEEEREIVNLVFAGGGTKGASIPGAMKIVEQQIPREKIKRCGGTSIGSIYAALYSLGMSNEAIESATKDKQMPDFISGLSSQGHKKVVKSAGKLNHGRSFFAAKTAKGAKGELKKNIKKELGVSDGSEITKWINILAFKSTKIANITFAELAAKHKEDPVKYKLLYIIGTNLSTGRQTIFCHENAPNMVIAQAVRISAGFPFAFTPASIWQKREDGSIDKNEEGHQFVDGGLTWNCPLTLFDEKRFVDGNSEDDHAPIINNQTLAIRYVSKEKKNYYSFGGELPVKPMESVVDLTKALMKAAFIKQESELDTPENRKRTIAIDNLGISTFEVELEDQKLAALVDSGSVAAKQHFGIINAEQAEYEIKSLREAVKLIREDHTSGACVIA